VFSAGACPLDIAYVVDYSGSIRDTNVVGQPDNWNLVIQFIMSMVHFLEIGPNQDRVAVVSFGMYGMVWYERLN